MMDLICLFIFTYVTNISNGKSLTYYSNFKFEDIVYGPEDVIEDYLTLADDPKGNLPESYTACSSVLSNLPPLIYWSFRCSNKMVLPGIDLLFLLAENMAQCQRF